MASSLRTVLVELLVAAAFAAAAGGLAFVVLQAMPTVYEATVTWQVPGGVELDAFRAAPTDVEVLRAAAASLEGEAEDPIDADTLRGAVRVAADEGAPTLLRLHLRAPDPESATRRADAVATAVEAWDRQTAPATLEATAAELEREVEELNAEIRSLQVLGGEVTAVLDLIERRETLISRRQAALDRAEASEGASVLTRTGLEVSRTGPAERPTLTLAAAIAALVSLIVALARHREASPRSVGGNGTNGRRHLADIPRAFAGDSDAVRQAIARLRLELLSLTQGAQGSRVFLITSNADRQGATTVACRLAEEFAREGDRTLLVDGDLWEPEVAERYRLVDAPEGVTTMLEWLQDPDGAHQVLRLELEDDLSLDLVPQFRTARPAPGREQQLFGSFPDALQRWDGYDAIIVDSVPVFTAQDTRLLAPHSTGTVIVTDRKAPDARRLGEARRSLSAVGARLLGVVTTDVPSLAESKADEAWSTPTTPAPKRAAHARSVEVDDEVDDDADEGADERIDEGGRGGGRRG